MSNLVNTRLIESVVEFINRNPKSVYAQVLIRKKSQHDYEGIYEVLKLAHKWERDNG